ncbi:hypothetical protein [Streptomyces hypolithicus]
MQTSAAPDLAHTRPRTMHWLATAAAMAAVVAAAGLLQPEAATASQTAAGPAEPAAAPDAADARYPMECGGAGSVVVKQGSGDLDGDGRPETVAVVRCASGSGTPPSGVFVLTGPTGLTGPARVVATLVDPADRLSVGDFAVRGASVSATLLGYSSPDVARCCPDLEESVKWQWQDGKFARTRLPDARGM